MKPSIIWIIWKRIKPFKGYPWCWGNEILSDMKYFITRTINVSYAIGKLSSTKNVLGIITCIWKQDKPKHLL